MARSISELPYQVGRSSGTFTSRCPILQVATALYDLTLPGLQCKLFWVSITIVAEDACAYLPFKEDIVTISLKGLFDLRTWGNFWPKPSSTCTKLGIIVYFSMANSMAMSNFF